MFKYYHLIFKFNINAGLITSLCRTVYVAAGFHGVMCTDVKINELLSEIEYFSEEEYSYGFIIDGMEAF